MSENKTYHVTYEERPYVSGAYTYHINGFGACEIDISDDDYQQYGDNCFYKYESEFDTDNLEQAVLFILEELSHGESFNSFEDLNAYGKRRFIEVAKDCLVWADWYETHILAKVDTSHLGISNEVMQEW